MTDQDFTGRTAVITGGGSGIGAAVALRLGAAGANVMVSDIRLDAAQEVADQITAAGGSAAVQVCDTAVDVQVQELVHTTTRTFGGLHLALNNAGIGGQAAPTGEMDPDNWRRVIDINLNGVFYGLRYQIPAMLKSGGGSIINMSSILGLVGRPSAPAYVAAKHAVTGLTKAAALDYANSGIRVNSVHPGYIDTPLLSGMSDDVRSSLVALHPVGRLGTADDVAELCMFVFSDQAAFISGSQLTVDGGYTAH